MWHNTDMTRGMNNF